MFKELLSLTSWAAVAAGVYLAFGASWSLITAGGIGLFIAWNT